MDENNEYWNKDKVLKKISEIESVLKSLKNKDQFCNMVSEVLDYKKKFIISNSRISSDFNLGHDTIVHGDYHEQNVFFDKDDNISHIFDFEKTKVSSRHLELIRSMFLICFNHDYSKENFKKAKLYFDTYNILYPIDMTIFEDCLNFHIIKLFHSTWIEDEHYLKGNLRLDNLYKGNFETIKYMSSEVDDFKKQILSFLN
jgi:hypothetical protein